MLNRGLHPTHIMANDYQPRTTIPLDGLYLRRACQSCRPTVTLPDLTTHTPKCYNSMYPLPVPVSLVIHLADRIKRSAEAIGCTRCGEKP